MKRQRRTPRPEGLDDYQAPAPGIDNVQSGENCETCGHVESKHDSDGWCAPCGAPCLQFQQEKIFGPGGALGFKQKDAERHYAALAKAAGADPGQAIVLCADGSVRLLERAMIKVPVKLPEPLADGTKVDVNNLEMLWLTYDERNYGEHTYRGNHGYGGQSKSRPDVPLYVVTNKNVSRDKPAWWKEAQ